MTSSNASRNCGPPDCPASVWIGSLCIVQQCLHVLDGGREREGKNSGSIPVERQQVVTPAGGVTRHEDLPLRLRPKIDQVVAAAAQKAAEIKGEGLKSSSATAPAVAQLFQAEV